MDDMLTIKNLKKDLHASEDNFKRLFNSNQIPQWIYAPDSLRILLVNEAAIMQYGYSADEFLNMDILQIAHPEEMQKLILYNEFMKTTNKPFSAVIPHRTKAKVKLLVETIYVNIIYNEQPCILATSADILEKIKYDEKISLLKVMRQQKITLATINGQEEERVQVGKELHDNVNQLLTVAKLYLEFARFNDQSRMDFIDRGEKILEKAINEIRTLSNSIAPYTLKDLGFKVSLEELFETYLATRSFKIVLSFEEELEELDVEIQIVIFKIIKEQLDNILKHGRAKNIMIGLGVTDQICLSIQDDGKYFHPPSEKKGLDLSGIRSRVELYNGTVDLLSKTQQGCSLLVKIPNNMIAKNKNFPNVLLVEDDPDDRDFISRAFAEVAPQYKITFLNDGKMLVDLLRSFREKDFPSLIVMDYNMPLLNGLETLKVLELDQRYNKIPKIIYSSSSQNYIKNLCYSANAKAYITKGTTMDEIKANIHEMLLFV